MGLAPNFLINGDLMSIPMVTEESSVVAAASNAAKFWAIHGGFKTTVKDMLKVGQVHFRWNGNEGRIRDIFNQQKEQLLDFLAPLTTGMESRGGGIQSLDLHTTPIPGTYQLHVTFRTADAMGANFINSVLEALAEEFKSTVEQAASGLEVEIIMAILSNYTPDCLVSCHLEADPSIFNQLDDRLSGVEFARKFTGAVEIAEQDPYRAVTHNKGIFNGIDAVVLATGNDFRAVEACGHAYASRTGAYRSLSKASTGKGHFSLSLEMPLALGTVGGLTGTHPMAAAALEILGNPSAEQLMQVAAAAGLANHFSAIRSLVTTGIQKGHMKMHLGNILRQLQATGDEIPLAIEHFSGITVSHAAVASFLEELRSKGNPS
jgi:hydroxymethylglutaryl-CoA reductase